VIKSGVAVLKIEGRSKGADYVYTVTQCYKEAMEAVQNGTYDTGKIESWMKRLSTVYNRGFWEGYYLGRSLGEWTTVAGSVATEKKVYVGKGSKYYPKIKVAEFHIEAGNIKQGDKLMITGNACGVARVETIILTVNGIEASLAEKGDKITFPFESKVTASDKLYKIVEAADA
jgi:putative protease